MARRLRKKKKDDHDHQRDGEDQSELDVFDGSADGSGAVCKDMSTSTEAGSAA